MIRRARRVLVVADGSKIGRDHLAAICPIADVATLVTDDSADPAELALLRAAGCEVVLA
jgi:DeoR family transcriptional regulator of aga operon